MDFPFDTETTPYAYVTATKSVHAAGHFRLYLRLPALRRRALFSSSVDLVLTSQCTPGDQSDPTEPFYAIRLVAIADSVGLEVGALATTAKVAQALEKAVAKLDAAVGATARTLEDRMLRYLRAGQIEHVYIERPERRSADDIAAWPYFTRENFDRIGPALVHAKRDLLERVGVIKRAA